ncbi:hypothetical protein CMK11_21735 [Candidatus Poribacteria bacterium]|nr:hypothetical protein [Candidatus Poribacteria bacterium]
MALVDGAEVLLNAAATPRDDVTFSVASAPQPNISVTPTALALPDTQVEGSSSDTVTIANTGTATLTVSDIASDSAAFTVSTSPAPPFDLLAQDPDLSQTVTVTFMPVAEGAQAASITITHNAAGSPTVITATGTGTTATGPAADAVTVVDSQGSAGDDVIVPISIFDVATAPEVVAGGDPVAGIDLTMTYDAALLTPVSDATGTIAAALGSIVPLEWSIEQNVITPGELEIVLAGAFDKLLAGAGTLVNVTFAVDAGAVTNTTSPVGLSRARLNDGAVASTPVGGTFAVVNFMYGDVTGNGDWGGFDGAHVLEHVAQALLAGDHTFPIELAAPVWAPLPLTEAEADSVADVDQSADVTAMDASLILQAAVGILADLPVAPPASPAISAARAAYVINGAATSERPGAHITLTLDASTMAGLRAGELVLEFDGALLRPVDVSLRHGATDDNAQRPLLVQREGDGRLAVAFASARPIEASDALLEVTFEATRDISRARESAIRASHLRLNRSLVETDFTLPFRIEPFQTRLMANYPNPFNPETWIPFELAEAADVTVRIYGLDGGLMRKLELGARAVGEHVGREDAAYWDGRNTDGEAAASGVYIYELTAGDCRALRRMVVMK